MQMARLVTFPQPRYLFRAGWEVAMHKISAMLLATVWAAIFGGPAKADVAQDLPQSGKAKLQVSYVQTNGRDVALAEATAFGWYEFVGVVRSVDGQPWFDRMTQHCTAQRYGLMTRAVHDNGSCLYSDVDGDKLVVDWAEAGPGFGSGTQRIVGGTGKFAGIGGTGTWRTTPLPDPDEGLHAWLTDVELDFQIKRPTQ